MFFAWCHLRASSLHSQPCILHSQRAKICDFICVENIKSLVSHIVTKHLSKKPCKPSSVASLSTTLTEKAAPKESLSLEGDACERLDTFRQLRKVHESNTNVVERRADDPTIMNGHYDDSGAEGTTILKNEKALEDQVIVALCLLPMSYCCLVLSSHIVKQNRTAQVPRCR